MTTCGLNLRELSDGKRAGGCCPASSRGCPLLGAFCYLCDLLLSLIPLDSIGHNSLLALFASPAIPLLLADHWQICDRYVKKWRFICISSVKPPTASEVASTLEVHDDYTASTTEYPLPRTKCPSSLDHGRYLGLPSPRVFPLPCRPAPAPP